MGADFMAGDKPGRAKRNFAWVGLVAIMALVIVLAAGGLLQMQDQLRRGQAQLHSVESELERVQTSRERISDQLHDTADQLRDLRSQVDTKVGGDLDNPRFIMWDSCQRAPGCYLGGGGSYMLLGVPDTFTWEFQLTAEMPVTVLIVDSENYICWATRRCRAQSASSWGPGMSLRGIFHEAEGCAAYFSLFTADRPGQIRPIVTITRNPADHKTGVCALSGDG